MLNKNYDEKCDVWSCGVILYILLCGYPPFNGRSENEIFQRIRQNEVNFPRQEWEKVSGEAKQLILRMLEKDFKKRVSAEEVLMHPWLKQNEGDNLISLNVMNRLQQFKVALQNN